MMQVFHYTGRVIVGNISGAGRALLLLLATIRVSPKVLSVARQTFRQIDVGGVGSVMVLCLIAALTGMIMVMQMGPPMEERGALNLLGGIIGATFTRELGPIWAAVIVLARVGSAMAAELGTMVVNEEVEALKVMSIQPTRYLVLPRILALVLAMPILTILADIVGMWGGAFVAWSRFGQPNAVFFESAQQFLDWQSLYSGLIKSVFFGLIIGTIACDQGLNAKGGAEGVGHATTGTVRLCVIFVLVADLVLTSLLEIILPAGKGF